MKTLGEIIVVIIIIIIISDARTMFFFKNQITAQHCNKNKHQGCYLCGYLLENCDIYPSLQATKPTTNPTPTTQVF